MTLPKATHMEFTIERVYPKDPPSRVFHVFCDPEARARWFFGMEGWTMHDVRSPDVVTPGVTESSRFSPPGTTTVITNDTTYFEMMQDAWLVFAYVMTIDGRALSSSLSTVRFEKAGKGTRLTFTEQGVYHDGFADGREEGTRAMLERVGAFLDF